MNLYLILYTYESHSSDEAGLYKKVRGNEEELKHYIYNLEDKGYRVVDTVLIKE